MMIALQLQLVRCLFLVLLLVPVAEGFLSTIPSSRQQQQQQQPPLWAFLPSSDVLDGMLSTSLPATAAAATATAAATIPMPQTPPMLNDILTAFSIEEHPIATVLGSYLLVTASDMVPFVPCQPLAIALGAQLGFAWAFPITAAGQTTAGMLAFTAARRAANSTLVQEQFLEKQQPETLERLNALKQMTSTDQQDSQTILLALAGLRLAPFFPFSAGNYLLGGATAVPLNLFALATFLGCLLSNLLSTSVGAGGAMLWLQQNNQ